MKYYQTSSILMLKENLVRSKQSSLLDHSQVSKKKLKVTIWTLCMQLLSVSLVQSHILFIFVGLFAYSRLIKKVFQIISQVTDLSLLFQIFQMYLTSEIYFYKMLAFYKGVSAKICLFFVSFQIISNFYYPIIALDLYIFAFEAHNSRPINLSRYIRKLLFLQIRKLNL